MVEKERSHYRQILDTCADNLKKLFTIQGEVQVPPPFCNIPAMTNKTTIHYSFDMAQQVQVYLFTLTNMLLCIFTCIDPLSR